MKKNTCDYCGEIIRRCPSKAPIACKSGPFRGERYCSNKCKRQASGHSPSDGGEKWEAKQMGLTAL
jgi:hypothetical protein